MEDPLLEHLSDLFYSVNLTPNMIQSPMIGKILTDQLDRKYKILDEKYWMHLNVTPSDQLKEDLPCRVVASVDVVKARTQIALSRGLLPGKYHGDIVGDKLSGLHIDSKMRALHSLEDGEAVFEFLHQYGTTTRTEYNTRSLYSTKAVGRNWFLAEDRTLNIVGCSRHIVKNYDVYFGSDFVNVHPLTRASHLGDGPVYIAFVKNPSTLDLMTKEDCLFVDAGEQIDYDRHAMMVYGHGTCECVDQPWIREDYWVARNTWGPKYPLVVRGSMNCVDTMVVPFVH